MIQIIDDDSAVRSSLSFMLKRAGYEAQVVPGPREAIEVVRTVAPDLILMDMNFTLSTTGEEGLTLLKQVKVFRPDTPVILMTANLKEINQQLPAYSQLNTYKLYNEEFEKTPKRSIKRFLYQ